MARRPGAGARRCPPTPRSRWECWPWPGRGSPTGSVPSCCRSRIFHLLQRQAVLVRAAIAGQTQALPDAKHPLLGRLGSMAALRPRPARPSASISDCDTRALPTGSLVSIRSPVPIRDFSRRQQPALCPAWSRCPGCPPAVPLPGAGQSAREPPARVRWRCCYRVPEDPAGVAVNSQIAPVSPVPRRARRPAADCPGLIRVPSA
jgi:hypothetical protein